MISVGRWFGIGVWCGDVNLCMFILDYRLWKVERV